MHIVDYVVQINSYKVSFNHISYLHSLIIHLILMEIRFVHVPCFWLEVARSGSFSIHALCTSDHPSPSSVVGACHMVISFGLDHPQTTSYLERYALIPFVISQSAFKNYWLSPQTNVSFQCVLFSLTHFLGNPKRSAIQKMLL
jgi:hypothetical protein